MVLSQYVRTHSIHRLVALSSTSIWVETTAFYEREAEKMKFSAGPPKLPSLPSLHEDVTMYDHLQSHRSNSILIAKLSPNFRTSSNQQLIFCSTNRLFQNLDYFGAVIRITMIHSISTSVS